MHDRDWRLRLEDILEAVAKMERYTTGMDFEAFKGDERTVDAVAWNFQVIGEAARYVPEEVQERHPEVPWDKMRGMRNLLVHAYWTISMSIMWQTSKDDLPPLVPLLRAILAADTQP